MSIILFSHAEIRSDFAMLAQAGEKKMKKKKTTHRTESKIKCIKLDLRRPKSIFEYIYMFDVFKCHVLHHPVVAYFKSAASSRKERNEKPTRKRDEKRACA